MSDKEIHRWVVALVAVLLFAVLAGLTTCNMFERDREAACMTAGGTIRMLGGYSAGCYKIIYEHIPVPKYRR